MKLGTKGVENCQSISGLPVLLVLVSLQLVNQSSCTPSLDVIAIVNQSGLSVNHCTHMIPLCIAVLIAIHFLQAKPPRNSLTSKPFLNTSG